MTTKIQSNFQQNLMKSQYNLMISGILITINHYFDLGIKSLGLLVLVILVPVLLIQVYRRKGSNSGIYLYLIMCLWVIVGFGFIDGLGNHASKFLSNSIIAFIQELHGITPTLQEIDLLPDLSGTLVFVSIIPLIVYVLRLFIAIITSEETD